MHCSSRARTIRQDVLVATESIMCIAALSACDSGKYDAVSDSELSTRARQLPLEARYDLYLDVYERTTPHRTTIAKDIVAVGDPAWSYTIERATAGDYFDLWSALPVINAFGRKCSDTEYHRLMGVAERNAPTSKKRQAASQGVRIACGKAA